MLSSQTKDQITAEAMGRLKAAWPDSLTVPNVLAAAEKDIDALVCAHCAQRSRSIVRSPDARASDQQGGLP